MPAPADRPPLTARVNLSDRGEGLVRLREELIALGLERHVLDLELFGYTVLPPFAPRAWLAELRQAICAASEEDKRLGRAESQVPLTQFVFRLLARGRVFEEALLAERPLALITYLLGASCQLSSMLANIIHEGAEPQPLHTDSTFIPSPFPPFAQIANALWALDDFTAGKGATLVVPGTHRLGTVPQADELLSAAVPIECEAGSVIILHGAVWHAGGRRSEPGTRVGMLCLFSRMYLRPQEDYYRLPDEVIARNPPRFRQLIGRENPYGAPDRHGPDVARFAPAIFQTQHPAG